MHADFGRMFLWVLICAALLAVIVLSMLGGVAGHFCGVGFWFGVKVGAMIAAVLIIGAAAALKMGWL